MRRLLDKEAQGASLRSLRDRVIGNKRQKLDFIGLGAVPVLLQIIASTDTESEGTIVSHACAALGSLAASPEGAAAMAAGGGLPPLLTALHSKNFKVVEASVRSLKTACKAIAVLQVGVQGSACGVVFARRPGALGQAKQHGPSPITPLPHSLLSVRAPCCSTPYPPLPRRTVPYGTRSTWQASSPY